MKYQGDFVFHNSKYDVRFLENQSEWKAPWHRIHDTMAMAHIADPLRPKGLKPSAERLVDPTAAASQKNLDDAMKKNRWDWSTVPMDFLWFWVYAALDPVLTCHMFEKLEPTVLTTYLTPYDLELATTRTVTGMEQRGMLIDYDYCRTTDDQYEDYIQKSRQYLIDQFGVDNPTSAQLLKFFKDNGIHVPPKFTGSGAQSMDKHVLGAIDHPIGQIVLNIRKYEKLAGTYFKNLLDLSRHDGRVHPNIWTMGTRTARMSVTSPALQTLPKKDTSIRRAFIPDPYFSSCFFNRSYRTSQLTTSATVAKLSKD
jgi:DNA polymerase-1